MTNFEEIYLTHFQGVYRYIYSLCQNDTLAEEITQETFFRAMENIHRFDGKCKLFVWLCQIGKNTYFTYLKHQKRHVSQELLEEIPSAEISIEHQLLDRDTAWQLHRMLHQLKEPYKEVFSLRVFGQLPFSQIGELFGKTDSWARLIFYRAKATLRRDLNDTEL